MAKDLTQKQKFFYDKFENLIKTVQHEKKVLFVQCHALLLMNLRIKFYYSSHSEYNF